MLPNLSSDYAKSVPLSISWYQDTFIAFNSHLPGTTTSLHHALEKELRAFQDLPKLAQIELGS
jgi:hypothetical protein